MDTAPSDLYTESINNLKEERDPAQGRKKKDRGMLTVWEDMKRHLYVLYVCERANDRGKKMDRLLSAILRLICRWNDRHDRQIVASAASEWINKPMRLKRLANAHEHTHTHTHTHIHTNKHTDKNMPQLVSFSENTHGSTLRAAISFSELRLGIQTRLRLCLTQTVWKADDWQRQSRRKKTKRHDGEVSGGQPETQPMLVLFIIETFVHMYIYCVVHRAVHRLL